jgi:electron transfer flavoprotein alpha subunit
VDTLLLLTPTEPDGALPRAALESLSAARALGAPVAVGLFGARTGPAQAQLGGTGVARVLVAEGDALAQPRYGTDAAAATALCRAAGATVVIAPALSRVARIAAGVAQRLSGRVDTHVIQLSAEGGLAVTRW